LFWVVGGLWVRLGKIKCAAIGSACALACSSFNFAKRWHFAVCCQHKCLVFGRPTMRHNVLPLAAVGDFGALHCQPSTNFDRSTALDLTTSAPIAANGC